MVPAGSERHVRNTFSFEVAKHGFFLWVSFQTRKDLALITQSAKRHLQDVLLRQARHLAKTSCRCPKIVLNANLKDILVTHLEETFARYIVAVLRKTS